MPKEIKITRFDSKYYSIFNFRTFNSNYVRKVVKEGIRTERRLNQKARVIRGKEKGREIIIES